MDGVSNWVVKENSISCVLETECPFVKPNVVKVYLDYTPPIPGLDYRVEWLRWTF
jgi:hypothetical protein